MSFPKKIKGTRDFKFLDEELQARTGLRQACVAYRIPFAPSSVI